MNTILFADKPKNLHVYTDLRFLRSIKLSKSLQNISFLAIFMECHGRIKKLQDHKAIWNNNN